MKMSVVLGYIRQKNKAKSTEINGLEQPTTFAGKTDTSIGKLIRQVTWQIADITVRKDRDVQDL